MEEQNAFNRLLNILIDNFLALRECCRATKEENTLLKARIKELEEGLNTRIDEKLKQAKKQGDKYD